VGGPDQAVRARGGRSSRPTALSRRRPCRIHRGSAPV